MALALIACDSPRSETPPVPVPVPSAEAAPAPLVVRAAARSPQEREHRVEGPKGTDIAFEPRHETNRVAIFLHALCGASWHFIYTLEDVISPHAWLVSPEGNRSCGTGTSWTGNGKMLGDHLDAALSRTGAPDSEEPRVLVGFSQGAWAALETAKAKPGRYSGLVLIGLVMRTTASELAAAGVKRVVIAAGDRDGAAASMKGLAKQLEREDFPVRYVSLGPVGHTIPLDANARLHDAVEWLYD